MVLTAYAYASNERQRPIPFQRILQMNTLHGESSRCAHSRARRALASHHVLATGLNMTQVLPPSSDSQPIDSPVLRDGFAKLLARCR
jgi:hypothetical protein